MFTYDPPQLSTKSSSLHGMSPGNWKLPAVSCSAFSGSAARAGNKARCGVAAATRSKSPGETDGGVLHKTSNKNVPSFIFQPKIVTKGPKIPSDQVMKMDLNLQFFIGYLQWNEAMSQLRAQVRAPVATAATSFSDRLGPWFNGSSPISRKRYDFTPENAAIMEWMIVKDQIFNLYHMIRRKHVAMIPACIQNPLSLQAIHVSQNLRQQWLQEASPHHTETTHAPHMHIYKLYIEIIIHV